MSEDPHPMGASEQGGWHPPVQIGPSGDTFAPTSLSGGGRSPFRRRRRWVNVVAPLTVVAVLALVIGVGEASSSSSPATPSANAVFTSAQTSLGNKTADVHVSVAVQVPGAGQITAAGDGSVDFANNAGQVTIKYAGLPTLSGMTLTELFTGGNFYLSMPGLSDIVPGSSWVSAPMSQSGSVTPGSSDPASMLKLLADRGATVTATGPSMVDGDAVNGFHVVIGAGELQKAADHEQLPPSIANEAKSMFGQSSIQMSVYISDSTNLITQTVTSMSLSALGTAITAVATEDFSNYGAPVTIVPPPPSQVLSLQQFEQAAASPGSAAGGPFSATSST
jgi:hypothetical protein